MNWIIGIVLAAALVVLVVALFCALIIAGRSDEQADMENNEGADEMFWKKQICPRCKTGRDSYILDEHSESCPYIGCWKDGKCQFYVPLEKPSKPGIFKRNKNKVTLLPPPRKIDVLYAEIKPFATI